jgi:RNA polymerase sigma-70 factor, ECF subfamily
VVIPITMLARGGWRQRLIGRAAPECSGIRNAPEHGDEKGIPSVRFEDRICEHLPSLRRYARSLCVDAAAADDLVQECLLRALRKRHLWRPSGRLRSWLFRMLYRLHLNERAAAVQRREIPSADATARGDCSHPASQEIRAICGDVLEAVETLPEEQRAALLLMALEAPSYREAARILGVPVGTLRSRLSRARETVRQLTARPETGGEYARLRRVR